MAITIIRFFLAIVNSKTILKRGDKYMTFADRLKMLRAQKGCTQKEIAKLINVSQPTYANYERGKIRPHINTQIQLAKVFHISVSELMDEGGTA